jgi:hypothetical protein
MAFPICSSWRLKISAFSDVKRKSEIDGSPFGRCSIRRPQPYQHEPVRPGKAAGGGTRATFVRTQLSDLQLNLLLTGPASTRWAYESVFRHQTVQDRVDAFLALAYLPPSETHEPGYLKVQWGTFTFECRLASVTVNYTSFDRDGSALRAELALTLAADGDLAGQQAKAALTSPDVSPRGSRGGHAAADDLAGLRPPRR